MLLLAAWLIAGTLVIAGVVAALLQQDTYGETARITRDGVSLLFPTELPPDVFARPLTPDEYARVAPTVKAHFGVYGIVQARFYRPDDTITFSFLPSQVGIHQEADDSASDLAEAFRGETSLDVRGLPADDNITGRFQPDVLETYVPVWRDGQVIGVAEVYRDISDLTAAVRRIQLVVLAVVAAVAGSLFAGLTGIYARSTTTIREQAQALRESMRRLEASYEGTLRALVAALDSRDHETEGHSQRVVAYARLIAAELGVAGADLATLEQGALLHDIGKIGIPDGILCKPGPLTNAEWLTMRQHPEIGASMLNGIPFLQPALPVVRHHHERWDGRGYPQGLRGETIPLAARIFAVADSFDAMTSDRPYRRGRPRAEARAELQRGAGTQFDPAVLAAFLRIPDERLAAIQAMGHTAPLAEATAS